jgi:hypothetical protein
MVIARSTRENIRYVLESERELAADKQSVFLIATLPNKMMLAILQLISRAEPQKWIELALRAGLRGWDNFPDEDGKPTPFAREEGKTRAVHGVEVKNPVKDEALELLPPSILLELANAILSANQIQDDDAKN